jgi:hypothetical protein
VNTNALTEKVKVQKRKTKAKCVCFDFIPVFKERLIIIIAVPIACNNNNRTACGGKLYELDQLKSNV